MKIRHITLRILLISVLTILAAGCQTAKQPDIALPSDINGDTAEVNIVAEYDAQENAIIKNYSSGLVKLDNCVQLQYPAFVRPGTVIGRYSYIREGAGIFPRVTIGRYCSIATHAIVGATAHPTNWLSTSSFQYTKAFDPECAKKWHFTDNLPTVIGNDVWIGANAVILTGVTVGDGAIIGAGAIVTKDVPPYAIVTGIPAKIMRYRFTPDIISDLLELQWWNLPHEKIRELNFTDIRATIQMLRSENVPALQNL